MTAAVTAVTAVTVTVPELLHGPFLSPQTSQTNFLKFLEEASTGQCVGSIP